MRSSTFPDDEHGSRKRRVHVKRILNGKYRVFAQKDRGKTTIGSLKGHCMLRIFCCILKHETVS